MYSTSATATSADAVELFRPTGYRLLIAMPEEIKKIGSIYIPGDSAKREHTASIVGTVIAMGTDCYTSDKFPHGAWCKVGDSVVIKSYAGSRLKIVGQDQEFRLINDDQVEAVVTDIQKVERAV
ncbi:GroS Co-chaperonin GroES (HSP10) [uncultured Caudovirales phage]|uniref:GroS Co-chaperonin GroES (HSP10) n=1 Tax=uncultured Caudovirales phage TaxID=2100421 RepID=A0A6J5KNB5_9CAUD|nr:GroS Co-chaperonin GroES (HSP10) [uncultured Caudovirales phage]